MSEEEDELQSVITQCLTVLLLGIETKLEGALAAMARMNWGGMEMVGDGRTTPCGMGAGAARGGLLKPWNPGNALCGEDKCRPGAIAEELFDDSGLSPHMIGCKDPYHASWQPQQASICGLTCVVQAGDQSEYVGAVRKVLMDSGSRLGPNMPANYFRSGLPSTSEVMDCNVSVASLLGMVWLR